MLSVDLNERVAERKTKVQNKEQSLDDEQRLDGGLDDALGGGQTGGCCRNENVVRICKVNSLVVLIGSCIGLVQEVVDLSAQRSHISFNTLNLCIGCDRLYLERIEAFLVVLEGFLLGGEGSLYSDTLVDEVVICGGGLVVSGLSITVAVDDNRADLVFCDGSTDRFELLCIDSAFMGEHFDAAGIIIDQVILILGDVVGQDVCREKGQIHITNGLDRLGQVGECVTGGCGTESCGILLGKGGDVVLEGGEGIVKYIDLLRIVIYLIVQCCYSVTECLVKAVGLEEVGSVLGQDRIEHIHRLVICQTRSRIVEDNPILRREVSGFKHFLTGIQVALLEDAAVGGDTVDRISWDHALDADTTADAFEIGQRQIHFGECLLNHRRAFQGVDIEVTAVGSKTLLDTAVVEADECSQVLMLVSRKYCEIHRNQNADEQRRNQPDNQKTAKLLDKP